MQSNILLKLKNVLVENNDKKINELISFLEYQEGSYITTNDIANKINISYDIAKKIVKILLLEDYLEMNFKVYCENSLDMCDDEIYSSIEDIPKEFCTKCAKECSVIKNIIIIYKVLEKDL